MHIIFDTVSYVIVHGFILCGGLDAESQEAEYGAHPEQHGETAEELPAELYPLGGGGWWRQGIWPIPFQDLLGTCGRQTLEREEGGGSETGDLIV